MCRISILLGTVRCRAGLVFLASLWAAPQSLAVEQNWISTSSTSFEAHSNWLGGVAPANDLTSDTAVFNVKGSLVNPSLTTNRAVHAIKFTDGNWTLGGSAYTLTVGAGGINYISDSTAINSITAKIELAVDSTWIISDAGANTTRTLQVDGVISGPGGFTKTYAPGTSDNVYGNLVLTALNTYRGQTILDRGGMTNEIHFNSIGNVGGGGSALGAPTTVENGTIKAISQVGLRYTGTGHSTDRRLDLAGADGFAMLYAQGTGPLVWNGNVIVTGSGTKRIALRGTSTAENALNGLLSDGSVRLHLQKWDTGHWKVGNDGNNYTGATSIGGGTLSVTSLADAGSACSLGAPTGGNATIVLGSTTGSIGLRYAGSDNSSTNRMISLPGTTGPIAITADGAGTIRFTNTGPMPTPGAGAKTLTFNGANTGENLFAIGIIDNSSTNTTSVAKSGTGVWVLSGANTYTGTTGVSGGTLIATKSAALPGYNVIGKVSTTASGATLAVRAGAAGEWTSPEIATLLANATFVAGANLGIDVTAGNAFEQATAIGGIQGMVKLGGGTLTLSGDNIYTGTTRVSGGTLIATKPAALPGYNVSGKVGTTASGATLAVRAGAAGEWTSPGITTLLTNASFAAGSNLGIDVTAGNAFEHATAIGGIQGMVKLGGGTLTLSGANTYTGNTVLNAGVLRAAGTNPNTLGSGPSQLILNGGRLESFADTTSTVNYARDVTVNANATISLGRLTAGADASATRQFGALSIGNATLTAQLDPANYTAQYVAGYLTFGDTTLTGNATLNISNLRKGSESQPRLVLGHVTDSGAGYDFTATGAWWYSTVFANGGVNVGGNVVLNGTTLRAVGDWSTQHIGGNINLAGGTLQLSGDFTRELGSGAGQIQLTSGTGGFSTYSGGSDVTVNLTNPITGQPADLVWGSDYFKPSILLLALSTAAPSGQLELVNAVDLYGATRNIYVYGGNAKISGLISNSQATPAGLIKHQYSSGTLWLANDANTFDGPITIQRETLRFDSIGNVGGGPSALGTPTSAANGLINLGITSRPVALRYTGSADSSTDRMIALPGTTGPITITADGAGTIRFTNTSPMSTPGAGAKTLTFNGTNAGDNLFAIGIIDNSSTHKTSVAKSGTGTWILSGANTYSGPTTVNAGTLLINGTHTGGGAYTVQNGATLGGTGTIGGATTVNAGAFLAPGASIGMLAFSNDLALQANSTLLWEFLGADDDYDSITGPKLILPETGKVNLSILALEGYKLEAGDSFTLFDGEVFQHGATEPFAFGADLNEYFHVTDNIGWWGTWELTAGSLVLTAVPEPGTCLMLTCLLVFGLLVRRRS